MTMALKWVKENIAEFGGDPDKVTIMGQSAGGASVDLLSICPPSRDLFHQVIAMAGNADADFAVHTNAVERCRLEAEKHGIIYKGNSEAWMEEVRKLPAEKLALELEISPPVNGRVQCFIAPKIDGKFITKPVEELRKEAKGKPRIVGLAKYEGDIFNISPLPVTTKDCMKKVYQIIAGLLPEKQYGLQTKKARDEICKMIIDYEKEHDKMTWKKAWIEASGDMFLNIATQKNVIQCLQTSQEPCYFYSFDYFNPKMFGFISKMMPFVESTHCNDITFALGTGIIVPFTFTEEDQKITDLFSALITNFVKFSDPNGQSDTEPLLKGVRWEPATLENPQKHIVIDKESSLQEVFKILNMVFEKIIGAKKDKYPPSRQLKTKYGIVEGRRLIHGESKEVDAFQGIPFAKPPTGNRRFELPQPPDSWDGVLECKKFAPKSMQKTKLPEKLHLVNSYPVSEDSLYLNVFTPCWKPISDKGFAVLVYIHGGGFVSDSAIKYGDINICKNICQKDVVCVTIQYRLGYFGFWSTGDEVCPGNLALWDMTMALKWVKENISIFGGNPDNVTIMGQSAGGASVDLLSICPQSEDLCHKVISMAGNASCDFAVNDHIVERCRIEGENQAILYKGNSQQWLEELRTLPAESLALTMETMPPLDGKCQCYIGPRVDGKFIPKRPAELRKEAKGKPRMVGLTRSEGIIGTISLKSISVEECRKRIPAIVAGMVSEKTAPTNAKKTRDEITKMLVDLEQNHDKDTWIRALVEANGDMFLNVGTQRNVIENLETSSEPCYFYVFDYFDPDMFGLMSHMIPFKDSTHCVDIMFALGCCIFTEFTFTEEDQKIVDLFSTLITNFAKYGDPNGLNGEEPLLNGNKWEPSTLENPQRHIVIDKESSMQEVFKDGRPMRYIEYERQTSE
ncbi:hypothetical protein WR25_05327 [Diploscapter pachys]|uniref:Carboxylesterase type B domain-containing protein n=1 Tax=Diploscapter pachys TaxID=2018661 RepID=A0A2A2M175_9BILA|nr:hypothetical protein WR25_05327 [Diploscapter pachys]